MEKEEIIQHLPENQKLKFGDYFLSFLNSIPYAGGTLYSIIITNLNNTRLNKICSSIKILAEEINRLGIEVEEILNEDQVVEIVDKSLSEIARSSSEEKINYLQRLLIKSFIDKEKSYNTKEFYLNLLVNLSVSEILLLRAIYIDNDPFINYIYPEQTLSEPPIVEKIVYPNYSHSKGKIEFIEGTKSLKDYIKSKLPDFDDTAIDGVISQLDSKGLSNINPNLNNTTVKEIDYRQYDLQKMVSIPTNFDVVYHPEGGTPIDKSQTELGKSFINYVT